MKCPATTFLFAGMVFASAAFAGNDINKCVTASGQVTLTDEVCPSGAQVVKVISAPSDADATPAPTLAQAPQTTIRAAGIEHISLARMPSRYAAPQRFTPPSRGLSLDVATLKIARANLHLAEAAVQIARSQRLAGLQ